MIDDNWQNSGPSYVGEVTNEQPHEAVPEPSTMAGLLAMMVPAASLFKRGNRKS